MIVSDRDKATGSELPAKNLQPQWAIVVFASRESLGVLIRTIKAAQIAAQGTAGIDIVINGNSPLALALSDHLDNPEFVHEAIHVKVWDIAMGDKANAWNQYIHRIWAGESIAFFIDGYVRLNPNSVTLLGEAIAKRADALGGTGVPNGGPPSDALPENGFHGNFCCIKGSTIKQMRQQNISLPLGLYRVDSLMGALLNLDLDPINNVWVQSRIYVHPGASWQTDPKHWWRISDIRAQVKRILRQSRGVLENLAVRDHLTVRRQLPELMPETATKLVLDWVKRCPAQANRVLRFNPLARRALAEIKQAADKAKSVDICTPVLMFGTNTQ